MGKSCGIKARLFRCARSLGCGINSGKSVTTDGSILLANNLSPIFSLSLLGGFALDHNTRPCELAYEKGRALLAYLAVEPGRAHSRASLAAIFWPDLAREAALTNLRQVLHDLRQTLDAANPATPLLQVDRVFVRFDPTGGLEIDVADFAAAAPACPETPCPTYCDPCIAQMEILAAHYRGEFMAGFSLPECPDFEEWLQVQREALHLRALSRLALLSDCHEMTGAYARSLPFALRFLELEPWNEESLRRVMRLFALNGQRAAALAQYETCCRTLKKELGILPSEETCALAARIRRDEQPWASRSVEGAAPRADPSPPATERRQITVLYCELAPADAEDPDEALALLHAPQARCREIIRGHAGHLVQSHGGGLLAYFGYPQASENAARLAVRAALALTRAAFDGLGPRVGVHTGVVISSDPRMPDAVGATSALAIHLRQLADFGEVAISAATQRLVAGYFESTSLGLRQPPGGARPLEVFHVERESGATSRLEAASTLTPLVGRKNEISALLALWQDARHGMPRTVLLRGEAGIGKSRLVDTLKRALREQACVVRELRCFPEHCQSPFYPLIAMLEAFWGFARDDTPEVKFGKLASHLESYYPASAQEAVPLLAHLFSLPPGGSYPAPGLSPQQCKEQTVAALLVLLQALAAQQPVLLIVEDLHWIDPSTLELLTRIVEQKERGPILSVLTARPEFAPPWKDAPVFTLPLLPLAGDEVAEMVASISAEIPAATLRRIVERADGIPLYAEEMAKSATQDNLASIPATLHDLLAARLDRMGEAKHTAQLAATLGREFDLNLLHKMSTCDPAALARNLDALHDAGLILKVDKTAHQFKHALIQEAAYQTQSKSDRQAAHQHIAHALQSDFPAIVTTRPEFLARHLACGGETRQSIDYWIKAGQRAALSSANVEAVGHFNSGLELLMTLPADQDRNQTEFKMLLSLCTVLYAAKGQGSEEATQANARISALSGLVGDCPELFLAKWALEFNTIAKIGYRGASQAAQQLLRMAHDDPLKQIAAHAMAAAAFSWRGEFKSSHERAVRVVSQYTPDYCQVSWEQFGLDLGAFGMAYSAIAHGFLGFPDQSQQVCERMIERARALTQPHALAQALAFTVMTSCWSNKPAETLPLAAETIAISRQHGFFLWSIVGEMAHGWALAMQGRTEGIAEIESSIAGMKAAVPGMSGLFLYALAAAQVHIKQHEKALDTIAQALADVPGKGEHRFNAELHRLSGEALLGLRETNAAQAEAHFHDALAISRQQEAKSLELRAAMSLARLWQGQGKGDDARRLLKGVYHWFTEGFDTPDLRESRKLLDSLTG